MPENEKKCAHPTCECHVQASEQYCSEACRDAGLEEDSQCDCGHSDCVNAQETAA